MNKNDNKNKQTASQQKNKGDQKDISNNLKNDAVGKPGSNDPTPHARTDNEQDNVDKNGNWRL